MMSELNKNIKGLTINDIMYVRDNDPGDSRDYDSIIITFTNGKILMISSHDYEEYSSFLDIVISENEVY